MAPRGAYLGGGLPTSAMEWCLVDGGEASAISARARMIRRRRGLSLEVVAGLAGITKQYLSALELGQRGFNRRGLIEDLAEALGCSVADLTGQPYLPADRAAADAAALPGIALAVYEYQLDDPPDLPARPVAQLAAAVAHANAALDEAKFSLAVRHLGALIGELTVAAVSGSTDSRRTALAALAEACMVGTATARHLGRPELAIQAARRGYDAASMLGDPALTAQLAVQRSLGLTWIGARRRVTDVLDKALAAITPVADPSAADTSPAEAAGMLHLTAAWHHALQKHASDADAHLRETADLAAATGERNALHLHFGPAHVTAWGLEVAVELGRGTAAAERISGDVPRLLDTLESPNRRCVLHFNLARSYAQAEGARDGQALLNLDLADRIAPQGVRNVPVAREVLLDLDRRARFRVWELVSLRNRFGISGQGQRTADN
ncbi:MAG: helix-turn-helix transcriptional regulator [Pseudonocardiales bacterium]|nr:helix-turn-helix transcriptional regulator [Pseudonocardiales bacterium]